MLVRGDSLSATMSRYLIDQIEKTPNMQVWTHAEVIEVHGETHLEEISVLMYGHQHGGASAGVAQCSSTSARMPRTEWLEGTVVRDDRGFIMAGPDLMKDGKLPAELESDRAAVSAGEQRARSLRRGRCASRFHQARCVGGRRGRDCGAVHSSLYGEGIDHAVSSREELRNVAVFHGSAGRATGLVPGARDESIAPGDIYVRAGDPADKMIVVLEGELQVRRDEPDEAYSLPHAGQVSGVLPSRG